MADPGCHYCDQPAEEQCPSCGRLYCREHGDDVCLRCLSTDSATPSALAYRGSILALALASLVTIFLLVRPPESDSATDEARPVATATAIGATATATPEGGAAAGRTVVPSTVAGASASPVVSPSPADTTHEVKSGDTLFAIAGQYGVTTDALVAANPGVELDPLAVGTILKIPPRQ